MGLRRLCSSWKVEDQSTLSSMKLLSREFSNPKIAEPARRIAIALAGDDFNSVMSAFASMSSDEHRHSGGNAHAEDPQIPKAPDSKQLQISDEITVLSMMDLAAQRNGLAGVKELIRRLRSKVGSEITHR